MDEYKVIIEITTTTDVCCVIDLLDTQQEVKATSNVSAYSFQD